MSNQTKHSDSCIIQMHFKNRKTYEQTSGLGNKKEKRSANQVYKISIAHWMTMELHLEYNIMPD